MGQIPFASRYRLFLAIAAPLAATIVYGCAKKGVAPADQPNAPMARVAAAPAKGRAQIWSENCIRCHNTRPPDWYSDAEWEVAMQHMRVRGYLTGSDHRAVEEFLKAGN